MTDTLKIAAGFATGTLLGASLALLFAPKKGSDTRAILHNGVKDLADSMGDTFEKTKHELGLKLKEETT